MDPAPPRGAAASHLACAGPGRYYCSRVTVRTRPITTAKAAALIRVLQGDHGPAVVFTRFRATPRFLGEALARAKINHEKIDGSVPAPQRHEAIARLRAHGGVLLSSEVGAEGLNLQFRRRIGELRPPL